MHPVGHMLWQQRVAAMQHSPGDSVRLSPPPPKKTHTISRKKWTSMSTRGNKIYRKGHEEQRSVLLASHMLLLQQVWGI